MSDMPIEPDLVGKKVTNPARPEWGTGTVLRVHKVTNAGQAVHRVSVQFEVGHKQLHVPPARLVAPGKTPDRDAGWLAQAAGTDLDGRLRSLPDFVREFLGTPRQRLQMLAPLYALDSEPATLVRWAREQARVADPLSHWSRDELLAAFSEFCARRDQFLRRIATEMRHSRGAESVERALNELEPGVRERMGRVLRGVR